MDEEGRVDKQNEGPEPAKHALAIRQPKGSIRFTAQSLRRLSRRLAPYREPIVLGVGLATLAAGSAVTRAVLNRGVSAGSSEWENLVQTATYETRRILVRRSTAYSAGSVVIAESYCSATTRSIGQTGHSD